MTESATLVPSLIQLALLLVILSAVYSAYMLVVIGAVLARQRRLGRSRSLPAEALGTPSVPNRPYEHPLPGTRFYPAPTDARP